MMKLTLIAAAAGLVLSSTAFAQRSGEMSRPNMGSTPTQSYGAQGASGALVGKPITKEEAQKKYPMRNGKYPMGERDAHKSSGVVISPYPPNAEIDCSQINHGELVVDPRTNKVFVRP